MELTIREARARFSEAAAAAARGEWVVVTRNGQPYVELVAVKRNGPVDWEELAKARRKAGLEGVRIDLPPEFDEPAFSRRVLGLEHA